MCSNAEVEANICIKSFIINMQNHYLMIAYRESLEWAGKGGWWQAFTHTTARWGRRSIAAVHPSNISVAGEADDDACIPPTQREKKIKNKTTVLIINLKKPIQKPNGLKFQKHKSYKFPKTK